MIGVAPVNINVPVLAPVFIVNTEVTPAVVGSLSVPPIVNVPLPKLQLGVFVNPPGLNP